MGKYFSIYENFLMIIRICITFVEIGILDGGSLEIWKSTLEIVLE